MRENDPKLKGLARHVLTTTNAASWKWSRTSLSCGIWELCSPEVSVALRHVSVILKDHSSRGWFPTVEVLVDNHAANMGGSYTSMPWSLEAKFLRHEMKREQLRSENGRRTLLEEIERQR